MVLFTTQSLWQGDFPSGIQAHPQSSLCKEPWMKGVAAQFPLFIYAGKCLHQQ